MEKILAILIAAWLVGPSSYGQISKVYAVSAGPVGGDMRFCVGAAGPSGLPGDIVLSNCGPSPYVSSSSVFPTATKAGTYIVEVRIENDSGIAPAQFSITVLPGPAARLVAVIPDTNTFSFAAGKTSSLALVTTLADQYGNIARSNQHLDDVILANALKNLD